MLTSVHFPPGKASNVGVQPDESSPTKLRGWLSFDSGTANSSTADAPKDGIRIFMSMDGSVALLTMHRGLLMHTGGAAARTRTVCGSPGICGWR